MKLKSTLLFLTLLCYCKLFACDFLKDGYSYTVIKRTTPFEIALSPGSEYSGELVKTQNIEDSKTAITIAKGNYIVQIGDITQKVIVK